MIKYEPILSKLLPEYKRTTINNKRMYYDSVNDIYVPSVTTILSETKNEKDKQILENWKRNVGEEKSEKIIKNSTDLGTLMHSFLEDYIKGKNIHEGIKRKNLIYQNAYRIALKIIENEIKNWDVVIGSELELCCPNLYGGTVDLIFIQNNSLFVGDFKTARKMREESQIKDYQLQLSAYALAINEHKIEDLHIENGKIIMVDHEGNLKVWKYDKEDMKRFEEEWLIRLNKYFRK